MSDIDLGNILFQIKLAGEREAIAATREWAKANKSAYAEVKRGASVLDKINQQRQKEIKATQEYITNLALGDRANKSAEDSAKAMSAALLKQEKATRQAAIENEKYYQALEDDLKLTGAEFQKYIKSVTESEKSNKSAEQSAKDMARALDKQDKQLEETRRAYVSLKSAVDPVFEAQQKLAAAQAVVDRALENNEISLEEATAAMRQYRQVAVNSGVSFDEFGRVMDVASRRTRRFASSGLQQAGYQIGDFAVQVQSGTNVAVAFGQQMSQLLGIFGPWGAVAGAAVAVATAFAAPLFRDSEAAKELKSELDNLTKSLKEYRREQDLANRGLDPDKNLLVQAVNEANTKLEEAREKLRDIQSIMSDPSMAAGQVAGAIAMAEALKSVLGLDAESKIDQALKEYAESFANLSTLETKARDQRLLSFSEEQSSLRASAGLQALIAQRGEDSVEVIRRRAELEKQAYAQRLKDMDISTTQMQILRAENNARVDAQTLEDIRIAQMNEIQARLQAQAESQAELLELNQEYAEAQAKIVEQQAGALSDAQSNLDIEERKLRVLMSYNSEGEKTKQTLIEEAALAGDIAATTAQRKLEAGGLTDAEREIIEAIRESVSAQELAKQQIAASKEEAQGLEAALNAAASAMARLEGVGTSISRALAVAKAEAVAIANETNVAVAGRIAGERFNLQQEYESTIAAGGDPVIATARKALAQADLDELETTLASNAAKLRAQRESSRGAGAAAREAQKEDEYLYKLEQEAITKRALVGVSEEQRLQDERRSQITLKLAEDGRALTTLEEKRIESIVQMEAETRKLMQAEQERQQLMDTIEGHIQSAFMTMVDGSQSVEDAFRSMLRNIILAIYQQQVAKPAAESIGNWLTSAVSSFFGGPGMTTGTPLTIPSSGVQSLLPNANGNVFDRGLVNYFANGGVVDSMTPFSYSGGTGIMGEAGPEAIMPLKRGKDGKLGVQAEGGGAVVIHQNFNFSANGDDSVKRIIRGEMPRITEATKAAVVDAKRRGGSYGRSF